MSRPARKRHQQFIKDQYRALGYFLSPYITNLNISANQITLFRLFSVCSYSILALFAKPTIQVAVVSSIFIWIFSFFDALDGEIASISKRTMLGRWLDPLIDRIGLFLVFTINIFLVSREGINYPWLIPFVSYFLIFLNNSLVADIAYKPKYSELKQFINDDQVDKSMLKTKSTHSPLPRRPLFVIHARNALTFLALNTHLHLHNIVALVIASTLLQNHFLFSIIVFVRSVIAVAYTIIRLLSSIRSFDHKPF